MFTGAPQRGTCLWQVLSRSLARAWQAQRETPAHLLLAPEGWQPTPGPCGSQPWPPPWLSQPIPVCGPPCELIWRPENVTHAVAAPGSEGCTGGAQGSLRATRRFCMTLAVDT